MIRVVNGETGKPVPDAKLRLRHSTPSEVFNRNDLRPVDDNRLPRGLGRGIGQA